MLRNKQQSICMRFFLFIKNYSKFTYVKYFFCVNNVMPIQDDI